MTVDWQKSPTSPQWQIPPAPVPAPVCRVTLNLVGEGTVLSLSSFYVLLSYPCSDLLLWLFSDCLPFISIHHWGPKGHGISTHTHRQVNMHSRTNKRRIEKWRERRREKLMEKHRTHSYVSSPDGSCGQSGHTWSLYGHLQLFVLPLSSPPVHPSISTSPLKLLIPVFNRVTVTQQYPLPGCIPPSQPVFFLLPASLCSP